MKNLRVTRIIHLFIVKIAASLWVVGPPLTYKKLYTIASVFVLKCFQRVGHPLLIDHDPSRLESYVGPSFAISHQDPPEEESMRNTGMLHFCLFLTKPRMPDTSSILHARLFILPDLPYRSWQFASRWWLWIPIFIPTPPHPDWWRVLDKIFPLFNVIFFGFNKEYYWHLCH